MWIQRDISALLKLNSDAIQIIRGPRQCGKTSLVLNLGDGFVEVSLDDPAYRELAKRDPELFLKQFNDQKLFIDEVQYAPELFPSLKRRADLHKRNKLHKAKTILRLTGSDQIKMDRNIKESLAGRASFFDMNTLSISEMRAASHLSVQELMYRGGWPELCAEPAKDAKKYLDDYVNSYIEKDIVLSAGLQKSELFLKATRLLAGRVGQLLDYASLASDVGVDSKTIKDWISILVRMHIVFLVPPFASNLTSRLVKSPKIYFIDTGLACRLQGWTSSGPILTSPQQGHLFENLVLSEIYKTNLNHQLGWTIFHWRSRDGEEIDFLIQKSPIEHIFVEAKVSAHRPIAHREYPEVRKVFGRQAPPLIVCHQEGERILDNQVPVEFLKSSLMA